MVISVPDGYGVIAEIDDIRESSFALEARSQANHVFRLDVSEAACIVAAQARSSESNFPASKRNTAN